MALGAGVPAPRALVSRMPGEPVAGGAAVVAGQVAGDFGDVAGCVVGASTVGGDSKAP